MLVAQLDYIYFSFGLVLFLLAAVCLSRSRLEPLPTPWWLLGAFALVQGCAEWLNLAAITRGDGPAFGSFRAVVTAASFVLLLEFARRTNRILLGATPGPWLHLLLGAAVLGLVLAFGPAHLDPAARLLIATPAASWTAALFLVAARREGGGEPATRRARRWGGFYFGGFGLAAGLVVPGAPFLPGRWPSPAALLHSTGVPVQLARALLVCGMAVSVWALAVSSASRDGVLRKRWTLFQVMAASIVALLAGGWLFTERLGRLHEQDAIDGAESSASQAYDDLAEEMAIAERGARSLAALLGRLRAAEAPVDSTRLAELVDSVGLATGERDSVAYVLDPTGRTASASNRGRPESFEGRSFAARPYFEAALQGRPGRFLGLGLVSRIPGFFASEPVRDGAGRLVAVAVVKRNLGAAPTGPPGLDGSYLVSAEGGILVASQPGNGGRSLWSAASPDAKSPGARPSAPALLDHAIRGTEWVSLGGRRYVAVRRPIPGSDWSLVFLRAEKTQVANRLLGILITLLLSSLVLTNFVAMERQYGTEARVTGERREAEGRARESARQASRDPLTGVLNRLGFNHVIAREFAGARRHGRSLSVVMLDLDHFKRVNDEHGHAAGDEVLVKAARLLQANVRESDLVARWGGEEFIVVASGTPAAGAVRLAEKVRALLEATSLGPCGAVTGSLGVAEMQAGDTIEGLLHRADQALYRAKGDGRNRVACAGTASGSGEAGRVPATQTTQEDAMMPATRPYPDTGFAPMDSDHRALSGALGDLLHKINGGESAEVRLALESVIADVVAHFAREEALMALHAYPGQHRHAEAHALFVGDARSYQAELQRSGVTADFRRWAMGRLMEWFRFHILAHDVGLGLFLRKAGAADGLPQVPPPAGEWPPRPEGPEEIPA
ncbi:MAG: diguanylate cyclase [Deltaproteobacteria bacterium]|nr:diguanylate cyclase [Deltaproteobacteria bacterium]